MKPPSSTKNAHTVPAVGALQKNSQAPKGRRPLVLITRCPAGPPPRDKGSPLPYPPVSKIGTSRIEAFSDGVIAIIVTIMVLQLTPPAQPTLSALLKQAAIFLSYALSFLVVAIMWVNHHHLIHAVREVNARVLWSNLNLLFWMSLIPFVTDFLGRNPRAAFPVSLYGLDLSLCGGAFWLLRVEIARQHRHDPELSEYHSRVQLKNLLSAFLYLSAAGLAHVSIYLSYFIYVLIPVIYFLPEKNLASD
jgi:uncharacterized membrane protein